MVVPTLSVVIIGRNEGTRLTRCLQSVAGVQDAGQIEVIYVDSASTDGSPENARTYQAQVVVLEWRGPDSCPRSQCRLAPFSRRVCPFSGWRYNPQSGVPQGRA